MRIMTGWFKILSHVTKSSQDLVVSESQV